MICKEIDSQFPFLHIVGSLSCTKSGSTGSLSCMLPSTRKGTILNITGGGAHDSR